MAPSGDDFAGVRPYQAGDAQKLIAWRLAARSDDLSVKQFEAAGGGDLMLDFDALPSSLGLEHRLSRLTRWSSTPTHPGCAMACACPAR